MYFYDFRYIKEYTLKVLIKYTLKSLPMLLPIVRTLYRLNPPIANKVIKFAYRRGRSAFVGFSEPSSELMKIIVNMLGANAGFTQAMASIGGIYTLRAIRLIDYKNPLRSFKPAELGLNCNIPEDCNKILCKAFDEISKALRKTDIGKVISDVDKALNMFKNENIKKTIEHEVIHSVIISGTTSSMIVDSIGWRVRFDMMYVLEKIYKNLGRALAKEVEKFGFKTHNEFRVITGFKGLNEENIDKILSLDQIKNGIERLSSDTNFRIALQDGYQHHIYLKMIIGTIIVPLLEVVTWYILNYDLNETLNTYVDEGFFEELHEQIAKELIEILERKKPKPQTAANAMKIAFDLPPSIFENIKNKIASITEIENLVKSIKEMILTRFEYVLDEKPVEKASPRYKSVVNLFLYGLPIDKVPDIVPTFIEILDEEKEFKKDLLENLKRISSWTVGTYTSFFIDLDLDGNRYSIVYDPLSGLTGLTYGSKKTPIGKLIRRTGLKFGTLEDVVGDLPLALRGFLTSAYRLAIGENKEEWLDKLKRFNIGEEKLRDLAKKINEKQREVIQLLYDSNSQVVEEVLNTFLYAVLRLGEDIKSLGGLHGLWIL